MYDAALMFGKIADQQSQILDTLHLKPKTYFLATVHRAENTDEPERFKSIFEAFDEIATEDCPIILPLHPRTRAALICHGIMRDRSPIPESRSPISEPRLPNPNIRLIEPVSFLDMVMLETNAKMIFTDSGGIQKEAYFHQVPCVTLRDETEWVETVDAGWNQIVGADTESVLKAISLNLPKNNIDEYGCGRSASDIVQAIEEWKESLA
jgi:UDP-GlcNAc3NAcA epimerase